MTGWNRLWLGTVLLPERIEQMNDRDVTLQRSKLRLHETGGWFVEGCLLGFFDLKERRQVSFG